MQDVQFGQGVFDSLMKTYILPEIERRQEKGTLPKPVTLRAAQVVFHPDGRPNEVRFNQEVKGVMLAKLSKPHKALDVGEVIYEQDVAGIEGIDLSDEDDPDCAHATMALLRGRWYIYFDFRYNKSLARRHLDTARQFHASARLCLDNGLSAPCVDNLYSAVELAARAELLLTPDPKFRRKSNHAEIKRRLVASTTLGNLPHAHEAALANLLRNRYPMRYLRGSVALSDTEVARLMGVVDEMIKFVDDRISLRTRERPSSEVLE